LLFLIFLEQDTSVTEEKKANSSMSSKKSNSPTVVNVSDIDKDFWTKDSDDIRKKMEMQMEFLNSLDDKKTSAEESGDGEYIEETEENHKNLKKKKIEKLSQYIEKEEEEEVVEEIEKWIMSDIEDSINIIKCPIDELRMHIEKKWPALKRIISSDEMKEKIENVASIYATLFILTIRAKDKKGSLIKNLLNNIDNENYGDIEDKILQSKGKDSLEYRIYSKFIKLMEGNKNQEDLSHYNKRIQIIGNKSWCMSELYESIKNAQFFCTPIDVVIPASIKQDYRCAVSGRKLLPGDRAYILGIVEKDEERKKEWETRGKPKKAFESEEIKRSTKWYLISSILKGYPDVCFPLQSPSSSSYEDKKKKNGSKKEIVTIDNTKVIEEGEISSLLQNINTLMSIQEPEKEEIISENKNKLEIKETKPKNKRKRNDKKEKKDIKILEKEETKENKKQKISHKNDISDITVIPLSKQDISTDENVDGPIIDNTMKICKLNEKRYWVLGKLWKTFDFMVKTISKHHIDRFTIQEFGLGWYGIAGFKEVSVVQDLIKIFDGDQILTHLVLDLIDRLFIDEENLKKYKKKYKEENPSIKSIPTKKKRKSKKNDSKKTSNNLNGLMELLGGHMIIEEEEEEDEYDYSDLFMTPTKFSNKNLSSNLCLNALFQFSDLRKNMGFKENYFDDLVIDDETGTFNLSGILDLKGQRSIFVLNLFYYLFYYGEELPKSNECHYVIGELDKMNLFHEKNVDCYGSF
jgi:hypothetical protein